MLAAFITQAVAEFRDIERSPRQLRRFGLVVGGMAIVLSLLLVLRTDSLLSFAGLYVGTALVFLGVFFPRALDIPYRFWMLLALILGLIVGTFLLTTLYYLVLTPIGLLQRLFGADPLRRRFDAQAGTYWVPRAHTKSEYMRRPF